MIQTNPESSARSDESFSLLNDQDIYYFREGSHSRLYRVLGAHPAVVGGRAGVQFAMWAPNAERASVIGDFNGWDPRANPLQVRGDSSGIWEGFIEGIEQGQAYKYHIRSHHHGYEVDKTDPFGFYAEIPPRTASRVWALDYAWGDREWMQRRAQAGALNAPWSIYEIHLGSWSRTEDGRSLSYREIAEPLADYVAEMGFTHVEFLPLMEHPFYGSWGYQTVGYFAPTSRYGTPQDLMYLIDVLHRRGIGVVLDWVPSHFPSDEHGLAYFDGTHVFEHQDRRKGYHPEWHSYLFNYGRNEVRAFLLSSALFWLDKYHADGLRVDAVASMLYLDYARREGEWLPNEYGGKENLEAISFLRKLNETAYGHYPDVQIIAEESTAWPMVSRPVHVGGLGFGMKWNMGWMHDTLAYMSQDPIYRKYQHHQLTFSLLYAFNENFILPLSHDEVVYGKGSLIRKMPGDDWQKFANLRTLFGYMFLHPGKKLLFMGGEFGQWSEWNHEAGLEWPLLDMPMHAGLRRWVRDLNTFYRGEPSVYQLDFSDQGFEWIDCNDSEESVISFMRKGTSGSSITLCIANFTPVPRRNYQVGVPRPGHWDEVLNSDAELYGGSGQGNFGGADSSPVTAHGRYHSLSLTLPPLGVVVLRHAGGPAGPGE
ncbi:MAG TPA: 1,4-alpha-glucan branching protein GlgB [Gammaproteobacteria bacterium]|nr:1,4-alpha-glucan branching protein GlgB [Gammaproteobacteria bacterium]